LTGILKALPQAMIVVSHDRAFRASLASRAVTLQGGRIEPASV
jgi:ATPase subunit of ABC transporter with duplicated ATPase domains